VEYAGGVFYPVSTILLFLTLPNVDRFPKFFHRSKLLIKYFILPEAPRYSTLSYETSMRKNRLPESCALPYKEFETVAKKYSSSDVSISSSVDSSEIDQEL